MPAARAGTPVGRAGRRCPRPAHGQAAPARLLIPLAAAVAVAAAAAVAVSLPGNDVSLDDGATWQPARVSGGKVHVDNPAGGAVSLWATATDRAGNKVEQTILRAYLV